jgi:hypothetical protein
MSFQVVIEAASRYILAIGPFDNGADFGPDYPIYQLNNDSDMQLIFNNTYTRLSNNYQNVEIAEPPP